MSSYKLGRFKNFIKAAKTERVAITGHFNSNGEYQGYGWIGAIGQNLLRRGVQVNASRPTTNLTTNIYTGANGDNGHAPSEYAMFGTVRVPPSTSTGGLIHSSNVLNATSVAPNLDRYYSFGKYNIGKSGAGSTVPCFMGHYRGHLFSNVSTMTITQASCGITANNPPNLGMSFDTEGMGIRTYKKLVADFWVGSGTPAGGSFRGIFIEGTVPNVLITADSSRTIPVQENPLTMQRYSLEATATAANAGRNTQLRTGFTYGNATYLPTGSVFFGYTTLFEADSNDGTLIAPLISVGGSNMHDWARALETETSSEKLTEETVKHWFDVITRPASYKSQSGKVIWFLWDGVNYKNETRPSYANAYTAGSAGAYEDDLRTVVDKILSYWDSSGRSLDDICIVVCTDHPAEDYITQQRSYTQKAIELIQSDPSSYAPLCVLDLNDYCSIASLKGPTPSGSEETLYDSLTLTGQTHLSTPGLNGRKYNAYFELMAKIMDKWLPRTDVTITGVSKSLPSRQRKTISNGSIV